jgi:hypothetical protein
MSISIFKLRSLYVTVTLSFQGRDMHALNFRSGSGDEKSPQEKYSEPQEGRKTPEKMTYR